MVYVQELRRRWPEVRRLLEDGDLVPEVLPPWRKLKDLLGDPRNLVAVAHDCHGAHHGRSRPFSLASLPDPVFAFACELLGAEAAYEYLRRRYAGGDPRLDALLS